MGEGGGDSAGSVVLARQGGVGGGVGVAGVEVPTFLPAAAATMAPKSAAFREAPP